MTDQPIPRAVRTDVKIVSFVRAFRLTYDRGPSLREIMLEVGAGSKTAVSRAVCRLTAAGRLIRHVDGLDVPGNVEAAVAYLQQRGWRVIPPVPAAVRATVQVTSSRQPTSSS